MKFSELLDALEDETVFSSSLLRVGAVDPVDVASQLSRWVASGRLIRLRRGVYVVAAPYRRREPHAFEIANLLSRPSYVSLESVLSMYGLIPEAVFATTSITRSRPLDLQTPLGRFTFRHVSEGMFWGYTAMQIGRGRARTAFVARPEKALLDLVHLRPGADSREFLTELRLERLDTLDLGLLAEFALRSGKPKLQRAAHLVAAMASSASGEWVDL